MLDVCDKGTWEETVWELGSEMDSPRRALLRLLVLAGPGLDHEEDSDAEGPAVRLTAAAAAADSDRTC